MTGAEYRAGQHGPAESTDAGSGQTPTGQNAPVPYPYQAPGKASAPFDPLRLCIFATIALLGWLLGPFALTFFAVLALVGYLRARKAGLLASRCVFGDTRLVIAYVSVLALAGAVGVGFWLEHLLS